MPLDRPRAALVLVPLLLAAVAPPAPAQGSCGGFTVVDVPLEAGWQSAWFRDVSVLPDGTAWAVGDAVLPSPPYGPEHVTLAMRWDGTSFEHTPTPYTAPYAGGANDYLHAVAALDHDDVWAAGERYGDAGGLSVGSWILVLHWDGSSWSQVEVPQPPGGVSINFSGTRIYDVAALAADDVWFAGQWGEPNAVGSVTWRPLALHWDGSDLTVFDTPAPYYDFDGMHLRQVSAVAPDDIWGICRTNTAGGWTDRPVLLHWDGSGWTQVDGPSLGELVSLDDVVALGPDDVWVFGHDYWPQEPFALHWDGSGFTVHTDVPWVSTAAALDGGELLLGYRELRVFDGTSAPVVADLTEAPGAYLLGSDALPGCTAWAVGRRGAVAGEPHRPLAVMRAAADGAAPLVTCTGDGGLGACPCGNGRLAPEGCASSLGVGMTLRLEGAPSVAGDAWALVAEQCPPGNSGLFFCGTETAASGLPLYDGLQCTAGLVRRFAPLFQTGGVASAAGFAAQEGSGTYLVPGGVYTFQYWTRDFAAGASPCGTAANFSPALVVTLQP